MGDTGDAALAQPLPAAVALPPPRPFQDGGGRQPPPSRPCPPSSSHGPAGHPEHPRSPRPTACPTARPTPPPPPPPPRRPRLRPAPDDGRRPPHPPRRGAGGPPPPPRCPPEEAEAGGGAGGRRGAAERVGLPPAPRDPRPHLPGRGGAGGGRPLPLQGRPRLPAVVRRRRRPPALAQGLARGVLGGAGPRAPAPHPAAGAGHRALAGGEQVLPPAGVRSLRLEEPRGLRPAERALPRAAAAGAGHGPGGSGPPAPAHRAAAGSLPAPPGPAAAEPELGPAAGPPAAPRAPGFPGLRELSLAGPGGPGLGDQALRRLLAASARLRLLDLRGCARVTPGARLGLPCADLEQLYLGLPCGTEQLPRLTEGSARLAWKWRRSLRELDLAGRSFGEHDLARAMAAFGPGSPLRSLNLAGTKITAEALGALLPACPQLAYLDLSSCRRLPRGTKRAHRGRRDVRRCLRLLAGQPPDEESPEEPQDGPPP
ncbi:F-box/LRR-repeat protein 6 [Ciconia boyciana]|uniref:F-box/LRR-repeat protein 6 n=1 Tax=Ciconia boyciana TaxID=52775 RepID=UPI003B9E29A6